MEVGMQLSEWIPPVDAASWPSLMLGGQEC